MMGVRFRRWLLAGLALALLSSCATPVPNAEVVLPDGADRASAQRVEAREAALRAMTSFRVKGGLGIWDDKVTHSARIDWRQANEVLEVVLDVPLGLGSATLTRADGEARLTRGNAPAWSDASADRLLQRALGLEAPVPVEQMTLWIRGLPGEADGIERDTEGRLRSLRWKSPVGATWGVRLLRYTTVGGVDLPALITASGEGYRIRLKLRDWQTSGFATSVEAPDGPRQPARLPIPGR